MPVSHPRQAGLALGNQDFCPTCTPCIMPTRILSIVLAVANQSALAFCHLLALQPGAWDYKGDVADIATAVAADHFVLCSTHHEHKLTVA